MPVQLSDTDQIRIASETAETFLDSYYTALTSARHTLASFYLPVTPGSTPSRTLPIIGYNGELFHDGVRFQAEYEKMPFSFHEVQSCDAHVLNPCVDPEGANTQKMAEKNVSIAVQVSGYVRLLERKDGPMRGFADQFVLVPNKAKEKSGKVTAEGRPWVIQTQSFRFVV